MCNNEDNFFNIGEFMFKFYNQLNALQGDSDSIIKLKLKAIKKSINDSSLLRNVLTEIKTIHDECETFGQQIELSIKYIENSSNEDDKCTHLEDILNFYEKTITQTSHRKIIYLETDKFTQKIPDTTRTNLKALARHSSKIIHPLSLFNESHQELEKFLDDRNFGKQFDTALVNLESSRKKILFNADKMIVYIAPILNDFIFHLGTV